MEDSLFNHYRSQIDLLETLYSPKGIEVSTYDTPINFKESLTKPIHRWYAYKEGFSPSFVRDFITEYRVCDSPVVFDPYGGVGTTVLTANQMGLIAESTDVSPIGNFASWVKNSEYTKDDLENLSNVLQDLSRLTSYDTTDRYNIHPTVVSYFDPITYNAIIQLKNYIHSLKNKKIADVLSLSLLSILQDVSTHRKNGNGVKRKIHQPEPSDFLATKRLIIEKLIQVKDDIEHFEGSHQNYVLNQSCLEPYSLPAKADIILTSPPYANCFDYSKVYLVELWMGEFFKTVEDQQRFREDSVISHVHYRWKRNQNLISIPLIDDVLYTLLNQKDLWSKSIPSMIKGYFADMRNCLLNLLPNLNPNATIGFVVGNPTYSGVVVPTDLLLAAIAETIGYACQKIKIYRRVVPSSQQTKLIEQQDTKYVRESLVILSWNKK